MIFRRFLTVHSKYPTLNDGTQVVVHISLTIAAIAQSKPQEFPQNGDYPDAFRALPDHSRNLFAPVEPAALSRICGVIGKLCANTSLQKNEGGAS
jgi:hypothetical protein